MRILSRTFAAALVTAGIAGTAAGYAAAEDTTTPEQIFGADPVFDENGVAVINDFTGQFGVRDEYFGAYTLQRTDNCRAHIVTRVKEQEQFDFLKDELRTSFEQGTTNGLFTNPDFIGQVVIFSSLCPVPSGPAEDTTDNITGLSKYHGTLQHIRPNGDILTVKFGETSAPVEHLVQAARALLNGALHNDPALTSLSPEYLGCSWRERAARDLRKPGGPLHGEEPREPLPAIKNCTPVPATLGT